jgi:thiamine transporter ThiT
MDFVIDLFVVVHLLGMAAIIGGWISARRGGEGLVPLVWGARAQMLTGLLLVGLHEMSKDPGESLNHTKIAVKLLIAIAVLACAEIANARAKKGEPKVPLIDAAAALTVVNVAVAALWH